ncbi:MAG: DNA primase [Spirochaetes bacterium]|nr:DNA primase [Spirochaetota bacterium]
MKIPDSILSEILDKVDPVEVIGGYVQLKKAGNRYWGLCPFHHEKTPSFTVSPDKGVYYCFGCHKGGGLFNFIMDIESISFIEAVKILAESAGVDIHVEQAFGEDNTRKALGELYERVAGSFHYLLTNSKQAEGPLNYLLKRGIRKETIEIFKIGYAPPDVKWLFCFLAKKSYTKDFLKTSGLFFERDNELLSLFYDRIIFPIQNERGKVIAFGGRTLRDSTSKYLNSPETVLFRKKDNLFGIAHAVKSIRQMREFIMVEGYMDTIAMHQAGFLNTIAPLGTAFTTNQAVKLKRYADNGILLFDSDDAGREATIRAINILEKAGISTTVADLGTSKDPADILQKEGEKKLQNMLKYTITSFQYLFNNAIIRYNRNTPEGKEQIAKELFLYIYQADSQVRREGYLTILADYLEIGFDSLLYDFINWQKKYSGKSIRSGHIEQPIKGSAEKTGRYSSELFLMIAVALNREYFKTVRNILNQDDFNDNSARELFIALEECFRNEESSLESLFSRIENNALKNLVIEKASSDEFAMNTDKIIQDGIIVVKRKSLEKKRDEIVKMLRRSNNITDKKYNSRVLLEEKMHLDNELEKLRVR